MDTKIILSPKAYYKMKYFVDSTPYEISGLGKSELIKDENGEIKEILVTDVIIFEQECTGTTTDIKEGAQEKFFYDLIKKKDPDRKKWNIWWHSHANFETFWSTTDDDTITSHMGLQSYLISIVTNKKGDYKARLDIFPTDTSEFKKQAYINYELEVEIAERKINKKVAQEIKDIEDIIIDLEDKKEKSIEKIDTAIEKAQEKIEELKTIADSNQRLKKYCEKEVAEKVEDKKFIVRTTRNYSWLNNNNNFNNQRKDKWRWNDGESFTKRVSTIINNKFDDPYYANDYPTNEDFESWADFDKNQKNNQQALALL